MRLSISIPLDLRIIRRMRIYGLMLQHLGERSTAPIGLNAMTIVELSTTHLRKMDLLHAAHLRITSTVYVAMTQQATMKIVFHVR